MAVESHLLELERKHKVLEQQIAEALQDKSVDTLAVVELKRRKLHLKEEIVRLREAGPASARVTH